MNRAAVRVGVIGTGAAGAILAETLCRQGHVVEVFDKARGPGGRMATRRHAPWAFDHGAQYFTLRASRLVDRARAWTAAGVVAPWGVHGREEETRWVGVPGMNALARHLLEGVPVRWQTEITAIRRVADTWRLDASSGPVAEGFDRLVLALPAPQARALLGGLGGWDRRLGEVSMAPCWAVMLADLATTPAPPPAGGQRLDDPLLAWVAHDAGKPGRGMPDQTWVLHATEAFSRAALEHPAGQVAERLWARFATLKDLPEHPPGHLVAHRWRHARVTVPLGEPCLWDPALGLGVCGDWCLGARVEAALLSGLALADQLLGHVAGAR